MKFIESAELESSNPKQGFVELSLDKKHKLVVQAFSKNLVHIYLRKDGSFLNSKTWSVSPGQDDIEFEGRLRDSIDQFETCPIDDLNESKEQITFTIAETIKCEISKQNFRIVWSKKKANSWKVICEDRKTCAYALGRETHEHWHFKNRSQDIRIYGLGEKSGPLNKQGLAYEMRNLDAMGYDASSTDPLYKHYPFYIGVNPQVGCYGYFYDNLSTSYLNFGKELDNYHGHYSSFKAKTGDLDYYLFFGDQISEVTETMSWLTGRTLFPPKWSLGYSGSTMFYTDQENSQQLMGQFVDDLKEAELPCNSFQLSSGYTSIDDKRYVFHWNKEKFPEPEKFIENYKENSLRIAANIKPVLLRDHPLYDEAQEKNLFIKQSDESGPEMSMFWDDYGSHLDFTNSETVKWWKKNVKEQLLDKGIESTWNDNNEYEVWDSKAKCNGFGSEITIDQVRPLHSFLMMKSSFEAQKEKSPNKRPWLISRCGQPGMQKYVQTWSGDNYTDWKTIKYNQIMGINLSLSGVYNFGHDVGGFSGPAPEPELLVRWIQNGIFHPRFTIHSWNDDQTVTEPWMYPKVLPQIQEAFKLRYSLIPYIYTCFAEANESYKPIIRPLFYDFSEDLLAWENDDQFMLGDKLLVATVLEKGQKKRTVYLPENQHGWNDLHTGKWYDAGQSIEVDCSDLGVIPVFVQTGSCIAFGDPTTKAAELGTTQLAVKYFVGEQNSEVKSYLYDDDGLTEDWKSEESLKINITAKDSGKAAELVIDSKIGSKWRPQYEEVSFEVMGPPRELKINGEVRNSIELNEL